MATKRVFRLFSPKQDASAMIRREFYADGIQITLKCISYSLCHAQAMKAEIMRSVIDAANHVVMYAANNWASGKGQSKVKNLAVMLPGACFGLSGVYNIVSPLLSLLGTSGGEPMHMTSLALSSIVLSSVGEYFIFYKNLGDLTNDAKFPLFKQVVMRVKVAREVISNKRRVDPIQSTIVIENVLAIVGVTTPIITSAVCLVTGTNSLDLFGEMLNGVIQVYLGAIICAENSKVLAGYGVSRFEGQLIKDNMMTKLDIERVVALRTVYADSTSISLFASVLFAQEAIQRKVVSALSSRIRALTEDPQEAAHIEQVLSEACYYTITRLSEIQNETEEAIRSRFPYLQKFHFNHSKSNILQEFRGVIPVHRELSSTSSDSE